MQHQPPLLPLMPGAAAAAANDESHRVMRLLRLLQLELKQLESSLEPSDRPSLDALQLQVTDRIAAAGGCSAADALQLQQQVVHHLKSLVEMASLDRQDRQTAQTNARALGGPATSAAADENKHLKQQLQGRDESMRQMQQEMQRMKQQMRRLEGERDMMPPLQSLAPTTAAAAAASSSVAAAAASSFPAAAATSRWSVHEMSQQQMVGSRAGLLFPPCWPQLPVSRLDDLIPPLPSVQQWKTQLPKGKSGGKVRVVWFRSESPFADPPSHVLPESLRRVIGDEALDSLTRQERKDFGMWREQAANAELSSTAQGDWIMAQQHAMPFYLRFIFAQREGLFDVTMRPLEHLEWLLRLWQEHGGAPNFLEWLQVGKGQPLIDSLKAQRKVMVKLWTQLQGETDVCVLPTLRRFDRVHTPEEWHDQLKQLETSADVVIFPSLSVLKATVSQDTCLRHVMESPTNYVRLADKIKGIGPAQPQPHPALRLAGSGSSGAGAAAAAAVNIKREGQDVAMDESKEAWTSPSAAAAAAAFSSSASSAAASSSSAAAAAAASSAFAEAAGASPSRWWRRRVEYVHAPHNSHTAPTVILPDYTQVRRLSPAEQLALVQDLMRLLDIEVREGGWDAVAGQYELRCPCLQAPIDRIGISALNANQLVARMREIWESVAACVSHPCFFLQPTLNGLAWVPSLFFNRGEFLHSVLAERPPFVLQQAQAPASQQQAAAASSTAAAAAAALSSSPPSHSSRRSPAKSQVEEGKVQESLYAENEDLILDVRGAQERLTHQEHELCLPQCVDFAAHILRLLEDQGQLASRSGVLRVDIGAEFQHCAPGQTEEQLIQQQKLPHQWQATGAGFVVRCFFNELHIDLALGYMSMQTSYEIVYAASSAAARLLLHAVRDKQHATVKLEAEANSSSSNAAAAASRPSRKRGHPSSSSAQLPPPLRVPPPATAAADSSSSIDLVTP